GGDEKLRALLTWADKKSSSIQVDPWLVRPDYLFIEIFYGSEINGAYLIGTLARASKNHRNFAGGFDLDRNLLIANDRARTSNYILAAELDYFFALAHA